MALYYSAMFTTPNPGQQAAASQPPSCIVQYRSNTKSGVFTIPWSTVPADYYNVVLDNLGYYPDTTGVRSALVYANDYVGRYNRDASDRWRDVRFRLSMIFDHATSGL